MKKLFFITVLATCYSLQSCMPWEADIETLKDALSYLKQLERAAFNVHQPNASRNNREWNEKVQRDSLSEGSRLLNKMRNCPHESLRQVAEALQKEATERFACTDRSKAIDHWTKEAKTLKDALDYLKQEDRARSAMKPNNKVWSEKVGRHSLSEAERLLEKMENCPYENLSETAKIFQSEVTARRQFWNKQ